MSIINVAGITIDIPDEYQILKSLPEDPHGSVPVGLETLQSENIIMFVPISDGSFMKYGNLQEMLDTTRHTMGDAFGLVSVGEGITSQGMEYVFRILKVKMDPHGVQYQLTMQLLCKGNGILISGYFNESGTTGIRDVMVFDLLRRKGEIKDDMESWTYDPYDATVANGFLMNRSEQEMYDEYFPEHPLTVVRNFIKYLIGDKKERTLEMVG